jgi:hypothetical protein
MRDRGNAGRAARLGIARAYDQLLFFLIRAADAGPQRRDDAAQVPFSAFRCPFSAKGLAVHDV